MIVGVLGGGQLGRMLGLAGRPLDLDFRFLDPDPGAPAGAVGAQITADYTDERCLQQFAAGVEAVTFEFENVPADTLRTLAFRTLVFPSPDALETAQDRLSEKRLFDTLQIPTPPYAAIDTPYDLEMALQVIGCPAILKTRRFGYDGKGQWRIGSQEDARQLWRETPAGPSSLIIEGFIPFDREVSQVAVRGRDGDIRFYPLVENVHRDGILRLSIAPAPGCDSALQDLAQRYMVRVLEALDYVGILTIEFFVAGDRLIANEMAPRVHNSGHWTIEGAETSQFENHLRAILGLPLGITHSRGLSAMWNILGEPPRREATLAVPGAHLHLYGKQPRPGRKIGHITVCAPDRASLYERLQRVQEAAPQS